MWGETSYGFGSQNRTTTREVASGWKSYRDETKRDETKRDETKREPVSDPLRTSLGNKDAFSMSGSPLQTPPPPTPPLPMPAAGLSLSHAGLMILIRLSTNPKLEETKSSLKKGLDPLAAPIWPAPAWAERFDKALTAARSEDLVDLVVKGKSQKVTLKHKGRQAALAFLQIKQMPAKTSWKTIKNTLLLARVLNLPAPAGENLKRFGSAQGFKAALLKARYRLPIPDFPTLSQACDALAWQHIGIESTEKFTRDTFLARMIPRGRFSGQGPFPDNPPPIPESRPVDPKKVVDVLIEQIVAARRKQIDELREAPLRSWLAEDPAPPKTPNPHHGHAHNHGQSHHPLLPGMPAAESAAPPASAAPQAVADHEPQLPPSATVTETPAVAAELPTPEAFRDKVLAAAHAAPAEARFGERKVFLNWVWKVLHHDPTFVAMDVGTFHRLLGEANAASLISLSRADLVEAMNPEDVRDSEMLHMGAQFHFVVLAENPPT